MTLMSHNIVSYGMIVILHLSYAKIYFLHVWCYNCLFNFYNYSTHLLQKNMVANIINASIVDTFFNINSVLQYFLKTSTTLFSYSIVISMFIKLYLNYN